MPRAPRIQYEGAIYHVTKEGEVIHNVTFDRLKNKMLLAVFSVQDVGLVKFRTQEPKLEDFYHRGQTERPKRTASEAYIFLWA